MAYTYKYQLRNVKIRDKVKFSIFNLEIKQELEFLFREKIKEIIIKEAYFQFKIYQSVTPKDLQKMGEKIKKIVLKKYPDLIYTYTGLLRMEQDFYLIVHPKLSTSNKEVEYEDEMHLEFIDAELINSSDFEERANAYYLKCNSKYKENQRNNSEDLYFFNEKEETNLDFQFNENIINSYFLDVFECFSNHKNFKEQFENSTEEPKYYYVSTKIHRSTKLNNFKENMFLLEKDIDVDGIYSENADERDVQNYIKITKKNQVNQDIIDKINSKLQFDIPEVNSIKLFDFLPKGKEVEFKVHNTGQAQATSIGFPHLEPFFYFDYGMPYGKNIHTKPSNFKLPIQKKGVIILSHLHKDHWYGINCNRNAYTCSWFIPDQYINIQLYHKLAEIMVKTGTVNKVKDDIKFKFGEIHGNSQLNNSNSNHRSKHRTGLSLFLQMYSSNLECVKILVPGDQEYNHLNPSIIEDRLDVLVATHHGGTYGNDKSIPLPNRNSDIFQIVYSCGNNNSYSHPTLNSICAHRKRKWSNEHYTSKQGDYSVKLKLN